MNNTLKTLFTTAALAIAIAPSANAMPIGETPRPAGRRQVACVRRRGSRGVREPRAWVADDGGVPLPMAGGVIAIVMLSFGGVAAVAQRRKTVRPAFPTC